MKALLNSLEFSFGGNRELDCRIAYVIGFDNEDVHGKSWRYTYEKFGYEAAGKAADGWRVPEYTKNIDDALKIIPSGNGFAFGSGPDHWARVFPQIDMQNIPWPGMQNKGIEIQKGNTLALAICIAGLKSREVANG